ncbi:MAG: DedA family protein [Candidatus Curtissbacteria bacterium]|nr:DedA family protein [Candidatus Curtissbacteria bacterium]
MPSAADLLTFLEYAFKTWGLVIIPIAAFLENSIILGFIFPGVTVILLSGFVARTTGDNLLLIIALASFGSFCGDNFDYFIGRHGGRLFREKPLYKKSIAKVEPLLKKYGIFAIFAGRFSGWSRAWVALAAGITRFPYWKFAPVSVVSAFCWTGAWIIGGYLLGANRNLIGTYLERASIVSWFVFLAILIYYFRTRIRLILELAAYTSRKHGARIKSKIWNR